MFRNHRLSLEVSRFRTSVEETEESECSEIVATTTLGANIVSLRLRLRIVGDKILAEYILNVR
jgi:hypothetical protein